MSFRISFWASAIAAVLLSATSASAQFYGGGCSSCGTAAPVAMASNCTPIQPVYSACYQTVPVTTYKQEKQTVKVPYYKTAYEEREVTYYEPVTRQRTVEVPTVSYQTVVENRTVHRDLGRWQTNYQPVSKCAPCQVDPRPGLLGWLNRTGYSFRSAMTPNYHTSRQYIPNMVACNVPVSRQVAVRGTRQATISETQMVARKKTDRVEVQKLAWREEEVTVSRAVTAYRTVPIGSALAYGGYGAYPSSSIAFIDDNSTQTAERPTPDPEFSEGSRSANGTFKEDVGAPRATDRSFKRDNTDSDAEAPFRRSSFQQERLSPPLEANPLQQPPRAFPLDDGTVPPATTAPPGFGKRDSGRGSNSGSIVHGSLAQRSEGAASGGWKASRRNSDEQTTSEASLSVPGVSLAGQ